MSKFRKSLRAELDELRKDVDWIHQGVPYLRRPNTLPVLEPEAAVVLVPSPVTVVVKSSAEQCAPMEDFTITITVTGEFGPPTGEVTLYDNARAFKGSTRPIVDPNGVVEYAMKIPLRSRHSFAARYSGDEVYDPQLASNSTLVVVM